MEDLVSSASLILAAITLLYTVWNPAIEAAAATDIDRPYRDLAADHRKLKAALQFRAAPLALAASTMAAIFLPVAASVVRTSIHNLAILPLPQTLRYYDPISATILFVEIAFLAASCYLWSVTATLNKLHQKVERKKQAEHSRAKPNPPTA